MATYKTPGVYIQETSAFPNSVVEVATAVPAFVGYTEFANRGDADLTGVPTRISTMVEFETLFGAGPNARFDVSKDLADPQLTAEAKTSFLLHRSMRLFFDNGGGPCWIISVGGYGDDGQPTKKAAADFTGDVLEALKKEAEPTMLVAPDAVLLPIDEWREVMNQYLSHCAEMQSRVVIIDVYGGFKARTMGDDDVISGEKVGLRALITGDEPSYGAAYYPWVNTGITDPTEVTFLNLTEAARTALCKHIAASLKATIPAETPDAKRAEIEQAQAKLTSALGMDDKAAAGADLQDVQRNHAALIAVSPDYMQVMTRLVKQINVLPPAAGMAGVYARTDAQTGVFKAPANTGMMSVISPTVAISDEEQEDLNVPLDGKAVNAIRSFPGRGVLIWGARTLDGNSQDWRYVNVRRTMIMLEQSIKLAAEAYVFEPNDATTWITVRTMIENFLNNQWKAGALAGARPEDAYDVSVGLGSTMTGNDILDGYMRVVVRVAVVRPAEFIVITFQQKMQTS